MRRPLLILAAGLAACCFSGAMPGRAQESSSRPVSPDTAPFLPGSAANPNDPAAALRDLLAAACAHDESQFAKFLTARNAESFARITPAARTELMKRFVLLDGAGTPSAAANPSGRASLRCTTPDGAAELQLGGPDVRESVAYIPLDVRDVSELQAGDPHHILLAMVRENSSWKVLSIGLLFLDLPSLEIEWDQAASGSNEHDALAALKTISAAVEKYRATYSRLPDFLAQLGAPSGKPSAEAAGLLDPALAAGRSNGYVLRMVIVGASTLGAPAQYELSAIPSVYGRTGKLSFFRDAKGLYHAADHRGGVGHSLDPVVE